MEPSGKNRAEFNRQNKDIDKVTSFLTLWQKEIQKRLTKKDRKNTEEAGSSGSRTIRRYVISM